MRKAAGVPASRQGPLLPSHRWRHPSLRPTRPPKKKARGPQPRPPTGPAAAHAAAGQVRPLALVFRVAVFRLFFIRMKGEYASCAQGRAAGHVLGRATAAGGYAGADPGETGFSGAGFPAPSARAGSRRPSTAAGLRFPGRVRPGSLCPASAGRAGQSGPKNPLNRPVPVQAPIPGNAHSARTGSGVAARRLPCSPGVPVAQRPCGAAAAPALRADAAGKVAFAGSALRGRRGTGPSGRRRGGEAARPAGRIRSGLRPHAGRGPRPRPGAGRGLCPRLPRLLPLFPSYLTAARPVV